MKKATRDHIAYEFTYAKCPKWATLCRPKKCISWYLQGCGRGRREDGENGR